MQVTARYQSDRRNRRAQRRGAGEKKGNWDIEEEAGGTYRLAKRRGAVRADFARSGGAPNLAGQTPTRL